MKTGRKIVLAVLAVIAAALVVIFGVNRWQLHLTLKGSDHDFVELGEAYNDPGADAYVTGSLFKEIHVPVDVSSENDIDINTEGDYTVTYSASYVFLHSGKTREVTVADTAAPVITLTVDPAQTTEQESDFSDPGFSAYDMKDGDLTDQVSVEEENGVITYSVSDSSGNTSVVQRKIKYSESSPTKITLVGGPAVVVYTGTDYTDSYKAVDVNDGDITDQVEVSGSVDTSTPGDYELSYSVTDNDGVTTTARRRVSVVDSPGAKTIYLTFDDGPGAYTDQLLDILAQYDVKATFFVTNQFPEYQNCIAREAREGHTVAVHTYTHDFATVYASTESYWDDFNKMEDVIEAQTGSRTDLLRFPGGSSNRVSFEYCSGIMTELTNEVTDNGYYYFDWNVSSGDAGGATTSDEVYNNLVSETEGMNTAVILCHDIKDYTVEAMPRFIEWAQQNGFTFRTLTKDSYNAHHTVHN